MFTSLVIFYTEQKLSPWVLLKLRGHWSFFRVHAIQTQKCKIYAHIKNTRVP